MVRLGLDLVESEWPSDLNGTKAGILVHSASYNRSMTHAMDLFTNFDRIKVTSVFAPQHGLFGETQDNMIEWESYIDVRTGLPIYSLYGKTRKPTPEMMKDLDGLIVDLQDIGSRYYTYIWTLYLTMESALENGKFVVVLDRPNPISGIFVEGPVLKEAFASFVGLKPLPVRHGMTIGEIATYFRSKYLSGLDLRILKMDGWKREYFWEDTGLDWVNPSPNMPSEKTALLYPGLCLLEATNISEGRGTTRPFEIFGAPFVEPHKLARYLAELKLSGVAFRPLFFVPTFSKYSGKKCGGIQIHIVDKKHLKPFKLGVAIIKTLLELYPTQFQWRNPPYEYENEKLPFDILVGSDELRLRLARGDSLESMELWWQSECDAFDTSARREYLLYD